MKALKSIILFSLTAVLLSSCVFSLFPIYTLDTLAYNENLLGTYFTKNATVEVLPGNITTSKKLKTVKFDGDVTLIETPSDNDSEEEIKEHKKKAGYIFKITSEDETYLYNAHLVKIAGEYYLDMFPQNMEGGQNLYPVHTFLKVEFDEKELRLINFNLERLNEMFKKNLIRLRHEIVYDMLTSTKEDGDVIITAKPEEIQKFIATYAKDPSVFDQPEIYIRK